MMTELRYSFFLEWFGIHAGRELGSPERWFTDQPKDLEAHVKKCAEKRLPCLMSAQPYSARDQPFGLEKLFFDFDSKEDLEKAWKEAQNFTRALITYYEVKPLLVFSGRKGYHIYVFLKSVFSFPAWLEDTMKEVYRDMQTRLLKGFNFKTLDSAVIGDIKRLARVPYSIHEKSGCLCQPINLDREPIQIKSLDEYREAGLGLDVLRASYNHVFAEQSKSAKKVLRIKTRNGKARPCVEAALKQRLNDGSGHKMRLAIAAEFLNRGVSIPEVAQLFCSQDDYGDGSKSRYYVGDIARKGYKPFKCATIQALGFCSPSCPLRKRRGG